MAKIIIGNTLCTIENEDDIYFLRSLDKELSFKVQGAEHTRAFKGYYRNGQFIKWDGVKKILSRDLTFPYGLLERVKIFYQNADKELELEDRRPPKSNNNSIDIISTLEKIGKSPYPYQLDTLEAVKEKDCGIIRVATGGGKSLIAALMTSYFGKATCLYVVGKDLLHQMHRFLTQVFDQDIGIVGDGLCDIKDINIVSVWTVGQVVGMKKSEILSDVSDGEKSVDPQKYFDIQDMMKSCKVHIFDECHLAACDTIQNISRYIKPEHIYGMSASPWRDDGSDLLIESIFGHKIVEVPASHLIENGYLVKPYIKFKTVPKYPESLPKSYPTVYKNYIAENEVRNNLVVKGATKLVELGYPTLVLYQQISHGKKLFKMLNKETSCMLLSGKDSSQQRELVKKKLENQEINCIVASTIFDIGVDLPALSGLVIAGGGKSSVRALQRIGRVIRKYPDKEQAAIIDFLDQARFLKSHSLARYRVYASEKGFDVTWPKQKK